MLDASDEEIVRESEIILSIVPPSEALEVGARFAKLMQGGGPCPFFVDCNAIGLSTVARLAHLFENAGDQFVDGAILGYPPRPGGGSPTFYVSGPQAKALLRLNDYGLHVRLLQGPIGAASALKLSYAGITKGLVAAGAAMVLAAERAGAGASLKDELALSQPELLARLTKAFPDMYPKAYRWVEEMHSIATFIGESLPESAIFEGAAGLYARLARAAEESNPDRELIDQFLNRSSPPDA